ncbi:6-bladed beta-propeller [Parabacteroides sp. Marseille-P3160]|uniref:6-bladed beta-propeller n=1 Tax=Parabacteroides sp. Marseille-P3160 TaxID=1917887 RepID=UPI0009BBC915|nr:6-bladed beta-propeller [Parabacteroides sp. Marseille-P3160]
MKRIAILLCVAIGVSLCLSACHRSAKPTDKNHTGKDTLLQEGSYSKNSLIEVDVTKKYSVKKIRLQDIADVEYIPLETNREFIADGQICFAGDKNIIISNNAGEGSILIFDRQGKAVKKINRKGQGPEEYFSMGSVTFDSEKGELYVNNMFAKKISVYDMEGNYKRSFYHLPGEQYSFFSVFNDKELIVPCRGQKANESCLLLSKSDGQKTRTVYIPYKEKQSLAFTMEREDGAFGTMLTVAFPLIHRGADIIVNEISSDTIFRFTKDSGLVPLLTRTPSVLETTPFIALMVTLETEHYLFMQTIRKEWDKKMNTAFPRTFLMADKRTGEIGEYTLFNDDYPDVPIVFDGLANAVFLNKNQSFVTLRASRLKETLEKGALKNELKEIAANLKEDDNDVVMFLKFKN